MKKSLVLHPFLFAIFPVLFLFAHNIDQFRPNMILGPIAATTCAALLSWALLASVLKDGKKAGLIVSLFLLLFFSYAICYLEVKIFVATLPGPYAIGTPAHLLLVWVILFALGTYSFAKTSRSLTNLTNVANVVAGCLVLISVINIGSHQLRMRSAWQGSADTGSMEAIPVDLQAPGALPDIYYIIVDGYARADTLEETYQYDNTEFVDYLAGKGFYVARESRSNYCQTLLSLASSLNLTYLDALADQIGVEYRGIGPVADMIRNSMVFQLVRRYGYEIVAFASGYHGTEVKNADTYLAARWYPDEFQTALMNMTPLPFVANAFCNMYDWHRERILFTFAHAGAMSESEGPLFVFVHIVAPHPPFVFTRRGEAIDPEYEYTLSDGSHLIGKLGLTRDEYVSKYREQLIFINSKLQAAVDAILSSGRPAIIILQADHGPGSMLDWDDPDNTYFKERLSILNAYYLPGNGDMNLYDSITPVNTFRLIFNHYFGTDYELLEDESYFSTPTRPYAFINVTDEMDANLDAEDLE